MDELGNLHKQKIRHANNRVENSHLPFRRIATRYEMLADNFLAMVQLASIRPWLAAMGSTT